MPTTTADLRIAAIWLSRQSRLDEYWAEQALMRYSIPITEANINAVLDRVRP